MVEDLPRFIALDNAAQIFIPNVSVKETTMSRISVRLNAPVDKARLESTLEKVIQRFPYFRVYLKNRFFGYVFEQTDDLPLVENDTGWPNRFVNFKKNKFLLRIKVGERTIAVETSHILTDGFGTLSFLCTLVNEYLQITPTSIADFPFIKNMDDEISVEEWQCGFRRNFSKEGPKLEFPGIAYIPKAVPVTPDKYYGTKIIMNQEELIERAHNSHVTVNVYLSAIYTSALQELYFQETETGVLKKKLPIRLEIPVNLRKYYPSECMRNFSYMYSPEFYPSKGKLSLEEIINVISGCIRHERHSGSLKHQIARNLRAESNFFFRYLPSPVKQFLFKISYNLLGRKFYSGVLTNLGEISVPKELADVIESFDILPANTPVPGRNTSIYSYKGRLYMNIGSSCAELRFEEALLRIFHDEGINTEVVYNRD